jgi:subtilisin family serine protease
LKEDALVFMLGELDVAGKPGATAISPTQSLPWGVDMIDADAPRVSSQGTGVKVGILDTGIDPLHADLSVAGGFNTINSRKSWADDNGHGTHVAGTVAALNNSIGVIGVAPRAQLYAVKVLNAAGSGYTSDIIEGLDWCVRNGIRAVNLSLGSNYYSQAFQDAVNRTDAAGVSIVCAAGNDGSAVDYPAAYANTIAVSAIDQSTRLASFSSRGSQVDLSAPGVSIRSTYRANSYAVLSGTSMATPHVTGVAALVLFVKPTLSPDGLLAILSASAENIGLRSTEQGAGLVDAQSAVARARTTP